MWRDKTAWSLERSFQEEKLLKLVKISGNRCHSSRQISCDRSDRHRISFNVELFKIIELYLEEGLEMMIGSQICI